MASASEIQTAAFRLPRRSRLKLATDLLRSVGNESAPLAILAEAKRRDVEWDQGTIAPLSESQFWAGSRSVRKRP